MRTLRGRVLAVAAAFVLAILYLLPTFAPLPHWWGKIFPDSRIHLGLDLRGGLYLTLEVKVDEAIAAYADQSADALRRALAHAGVLGAQVTRKGSDGIEIALPPGADARPARQALADALPDFAPALPGAAFGRILARLKPDKAEKIREGAVEQAQATLRSRIDQYGVAEPSVQRQGRNRIVLQLPGVQHPEEVQRLIGTTARLEFKELDDASDLLRPLLANLPPGIAFKNDDRKPSPIPLEECPWCGRKFKAASFELFWKKR